MQRAYLCPIVESVSDLTGGRFFAPKLPELPPGASVSSTIPVGKDGVPLHSHALVVVTAGDFAKLDADLQIEKLDAVPATRDAAELERLMAARATKGE